MSRNHQPDEVIWYPAEGQRVRWIKESNTVVFTDRDKDFEITTPLMHYFDDALAIQDEFQSPAIPPTSSQPSVWAPPSQNEPSTQEWSYSS